MITPRVPRWAFVIFRPLGLTALHPLPTCVLQPPPPFPEPQNFRYILTRLHESIQP